MAVHLVLSSYLFWLLYKNMNRKLKFRLETKETNTSIETVEMPKITSREDCESSISKIDKSLKNAGYFDSGIDKIVDKTDAIKQEKSAKNLSENVSLAKTTETNETSSSLTLAKFSINFTISGEMKIDPLAKRTNEQPLVNLNVNKESPKLSLHCDTSTNEAKQIEETTIKTQALASAVEIFVNNLAAAMTNMPLPSAASLIPSSGPKETVNVTVDSQGEELVTLLASDAASGIENPIAAPVRDDEKKSIPNFVGENKNPLIFNMGKSTEQIFGVERNKMEFAFGSVTSAPSFKKATLSGSEIEKKPATDFGLFGFGTSSQVLRDVKARKVSEFEIESSKFKKLQKVPGYDFANSVSDLEENKSTKNFNFGKAASSLEETKTETVIFSFGNPTSTSSQRNNSKPVFGSAVPVSSRRQNRQSSMFGNNCAYTSNSRYIAKAIRQK